MNQVISLIAVNLTDLVILVHIVILVILVNLVILKNLSIYGVRVSLFESF